MRWTVNLPLSCCRKRMLQLSRSPFWLQPMTTFASATHSKKKKKKLTVDYEYRLTGSATTRLMHNRATMLRVTRSTDYRLKLSTKFSTEVSRDSRHNTTRDATQHRSSQVNMSTRRRVWQRVSANTAVVVTATIIVRKYYLQRKLHPRLLRIMLHEIVAREWIKW